MAGLSAQATLSQIFVNIYLPVLLKGGATLATVGLMKPGFELRNLGLSLIDSDTELGFDLYVEGGKIIAEAAKFLSTANAIIDYGLAINGAIGLFTNPAKVAGIIRTTSLTQTTRITQVIQTIVLEADDLLIVSQRMITRIQRTTSITQTTRLIKDYSEKILEFVSLVFSLINL